MFNTAIKKLIENKQYNFPLLNKIICGDSAELLLQIPSESIDLVITSPPYFNQRDYGAGFGNEETCQKYIENLLQTFQDYPVAIIEEFLNLLTEENDIVLDPFIGSGSTVVAAIKKNRNFIGFDINADYCEYARKRIEQAELQQKLF